MLTLPAMFSSHRVGWKCRQLDPGQQDIQLGPPLLGACGALPQHDVPHRAGCRRGLLCHCQPQQYAALYVLVNTNMVCLAAVDLNTTELMVNNLHAYTEYSFRVTSRDVYGYYNDDTGALLVTTTYIPGTFSAPCCFALLILALCSPRCNSAWRVDLNVAVDQLDRLCPRRDVQRLLPPPDWRAQCRCWLHIRFSH